jgi:DNA-binding NarL/FixJ family response regulator
LKNLSDNLQFLTTAWEFIRENHSEYQLPRTACQAQELLESTKQYQPNIIITDADLPGMCSLELCRRLPEHCPGTRIIVRCTDDMAWHARRMLRVGAMGILSKNACKAELRQCINWVHQGSLHLPKECRHLHIRKFKEERELGEFEMAVLLNLCLRKTLEQIKDELFASLSKVRRAKEHINRLANAHDSIGIMRWAWLQGYISLRECWGL